MSMSDSAVKEGSASGERTIDSDRFERACIESMSVAFTGPAIAEVDHDDETYEVELESGRCECDDYRFRGDSVVCKHAQRACLAALFDSEQHSTALVARVARFAREQGCVHGVRGCRGPTTTSDRLAGLPCQQCIESVRTADVDEFTVYQRLVTTSCESTPRVMPDGGQITLDESGSDDNEPREWEDPPLTEIVDRFRDALGAPDLDGWTLSTHRDLTEIGGFVRLYHDDAKIAIRVYDAISVSFDVEHADAERRRDRPNSNWRSESSLDSPDDALTVARALNGLTLDEREELGTKWLGMRALAGEVEA